MYKIERNKPLLDSNGNAQLLVHQGGKIFFDRESFGVLVSLPDVSRDESRAFRTGPLRYGVYVDNAVPFFVLNFENAFCLDCSFNFFPDRQEIGRFRHSVANSVQMILCDQKGSIVKGIRLIGLEPLAMKTIRDCIEKQYEQHDSPDSVIASIRNTERNLQPKDMLAKIKTWRLK